MIILDSVEKLRDYLNNHKILYNVMIKGITFNQEGVFPSVVHLQNMENIIFQDCIFHDRDSVNYLHLYIKGFLKFINVKSEDSFDFTSHFDDYPKPVDASIDHSYFYFASFDTGVRSLRVINSDIDRLRLGGIYDYQEVFFVNSSIDTLTFLDSSDDFTFKNFVIQNCDVNHIKFIHNISIRDFKKDNKLVNWLIESDIDTLFSYATFFDSDVSGMKFRKISFLDHILFNNCDVSGADFTDVVLRYGFHGLFFKECQGVDTINLPENITLRRGSVGELITAEKGS